MLMAHMEKLSPTTFHINLKGKDLAQVTVLVSYLLYFTHKIKVQKKETNLICNIIYPKFPCRICEKNVHDKDKAVQYNL